MKWAWVSGNRPELIAKFLPHNYEVVASMGEYTLIGGIDDSGWTMQDYVIPRLRSGLMGCNEVKDPTVIDMLNKVWEDKL